MEHFCRYGELSNSAVPTLNRVCNDRDDFSVSREQIVKSLLSACAAARSMHKKAVFHVDDARAHVRSKDGVQWR